MGGCHQRSGWRRGAAAPCRWSRRRGARRPRARTGSPSASARRRDLSRSACARAGDWRVRRSPRSAAPSDSTPRSPRRPSRPWSVPTGIFEGRGHNVLGDAVHPVRQLAGPGWPPCGQELVAPPADKQSLGVEHLVERGLVKPLAVVAPDLGEPAAVPEALFTGRVLDDSVERDVLADDDLSHFALLSMAVSAATNADAASSGTGRSPTAKFGPRPASIGCGKSSSRKGGARVERADLMSRARAGDGDAFRELTEPY